MSEPSNSNDSGQTPISDRVVLIASGGLDSTTLLYRLLHENKEVFVITFNYGQKHQKEIECAKKTCTRFGVIQKIVYLEELTRSGIFGDNALTSDRKVPEGHYTDENMTSTVVPNRNMIMLSIAFAYAISVGAEEVYYGAHAGDHDIYPDCRPNFVIAMQSVARLCHYWPIELRVPYLHVPKGEIVTEGLKLNVDYTLTWTCYNGQALACGKCGSCVERLEAFQVNNVIDPLKYQEQ